jgi:GNAT superfamily N-acetyltransferase
MRAVEFITESKTVEYEGLTLKISKNGHQLMVNALDDWGNKVLGHVTFNIGDGKELDPQDLKVDDKYQGQGIAKVMYDYVKSLGYTIVRSYDQTDAGAGFWNKHRGEDVRIWEQGVAEGEDKSKDPIVNAVIDFYQHVGKIHKDPIDDYVSTAKEMLGHVSDPTLKSKLLDIFKQAKQSPYVQGGVVTTIGALLAGGVLSSAQKMGLSPAQTNLALQAILNTIIPTVVSRINGKSWSDTVKYTLASAGIGTGIAGMMDEARGLAPTKPYDDLMANMGYFMSLNTVKIQQDAVDNDAQQELANMQQQFRKPILNGMSFFDVNRDIKMSKNPKVAPILLKYVYDMLGYIEPRIKKYIKPEQQGKYLDRLDQIKNDYRAAVAQVS